MLSHLKHVSCCVLAWHVKQKDIETACSGTGQDSLLPVVCSLGKEMLHYLQALGSGDAREALAYFRGAYRCELMVTQMLNMSRVGWLKFLAQESTVRIYHIRRLLLFS